MQYIVQLWPAGAQAEGVTRIPITFKHTVMTPEQRNAHQQVRVCGVPSAFHFVLFPKSTNFRALRSLCLSTQKYWRDVWSIYWTRWCSTFCHARAVEPPVSRWCIFIDFSADSGGSLVFMFLKCEIQTVSSLRTSASEKKTQENFLDSSECLKPRFCLL